MMESGNESSSECHAKAITSPSSEGMRLIVMNVCLMAFTMTFTVLRMLSRWLRHQKPFGEDYLHIMALICFHGLCWLSIAMSVRGFGCHTWELQTSNITELLKMAFSTVFLYAVSLGLVKISICWSLARIFSTPLLVLSARVLMVLSALWALITMLVSLLFCQPTSLNWTMATGGHCVNLKAAYISLACFDVLVDLFILILPFPTIWNLQMSSATRVGLIAIFSMGILTMICGILRPVVILRVSGEDTLYTGVLGHIWTIVENGVAIIVSSGPFLRPIFERVSSAFMSLAHTIQSTASGKQSLGHTDDERSLFTGTPAGFPQQWNHNGESLELTDPPERRHTVWPSRSTLTMV